MFRPSPGTSGETHDEHRLLSNVLADLVAQDPSHAEACEQAGDSWGRRLVEGSGSGATADDELALGELVRLLDQQGFAPRISGSELEMHRCPFFDLAETHPDVVCAIHVGLMRGALAQLGAQVSVSSLDIFPRLGVCVARLGRETQVG